VLLTRRPKATTKAAAMVSAKTSALKSDDEKRLARNAALREWRKANRDKVNAYMRAWKAKKAAEPKDGSKKTVVADGTGNAPGPQPTSESQ
jgi:hypothetical protein